MDVHEPDVRSYNMSRIRSTNTKPELLVRKFLHNNGLRYRIHQNNLPGKPDIVLKKFNSIVLVNGCFWHGHSCLKTTPETRVEYWSEKISRNKSRDLEVIKSLKSLGWRVKIIWECELKSKKERCFC